MASKILVKGAKLSSDIVTLTERNKGLSQTTVRQQSINVDRVAQLEQNMKFLQEQHQATLIALHREVETLRQQNRDLQFKLVFSKGPACVPCTPSSPEDNETGFAKSKGSPVCVNVTPLQVELLEKDLHDTKTSLRKAQTENEELSGVIEWLKIQLDTMKEEKHKPLAVDIGIQVEGTFDCVRTELRTYLNEVELMVKLLRMQNEDQRKEIASLKAAPANGTNANNGGRSCDGNDSHDIHASSANSTQEQASHRFPPLQNHGHRHRKLPRNERRRHDKQDHPRKTDSSVLPQLQNGNTKTDNQAFQPVYPSGRHRNYDQVESNHKYRREVSQRNRRGLTDHYYHRRDYKERNPKDQKEPVDARKFVSDSDADNSTGSKS